MLEHEVAFLPQQERVARSRGEEPRMNREAGVYRHPNPGHCRQTVGPVYCVFFLSGAAALLYEISWFRQVGLLFGHTVHAAAVVLTTYFAGLGVGYALGAKLAGRVKPLRAYAVAEFAAAGWACLVPYVLSVTASSGLAAVLNGPSPIGHLAFRWLFCFLLLLPATAALGTTLPLLAEWLSPTRDPEVGRVASAYACNTGGAFVGTVLGTVWLLVTVGVAASGYVAAGLSALCGVAMLLLQRVERFLPAENTTSPAISSNRRAPGGFGLFWSLLSAGLSGFGILALEVLYNRLFSLVFHNSTYTFGAVLAAVILGLALGPLLVRLASRKLPYLTLLAWGAGAGSVTSVLSLYLFVLATRLEYFLFGDSFAAYMAGAFAIVAAVVVPPMTLLGMILPAVWCGETGRGRTAEVIARTTLVSTLAGAGGAASASLFLLPSLGLWTSFGVVALLFVLLALGSLSAQGRVRTAITGGLVFGFAVLPLLVPPGPERWASSGPDVLVRRWDSSYGWIDVVVGEDGAKKVRQNLHYRFGNTGKDAPRAYRQAHLPLLLHPRPSAVLFLGLGTGLTAGASVPHSEVERVVVVELIPEVVEAARLLADANFGVVDHPKVKVEIDDARHYLLTTDRQFDVIVSDLFVPWESETGYLYTVEHYRAARQRLMPGGVFCQWLPAYQLSSRELELIADSFASVFPETSLWWGYVNSRLPIVALIGSNRPLHLDGRDVDARLKRLYKTAPLDEEMRTVKDVVGLYLGDWRSRQPQRLNTDEFPRVEFLTPVSQGDKALLQGATLRSYYDEVLARLPDRSERFGVSLDRPETRRAWHRLVLFPE
jgi:spermidine synthase